MRKMCDEIVCIENIVDLQATYSVLELKLSMLIEEIDRECKQGMIDILHFKILLYALRDVPFKDEGKAHRLLTALVEYFENELFGRSKEWSIFRILKKIQKLQKYILWDYMLNGSFTVYYDETVWWELIVKIIKPEEFSQLLPMLEI